MKIRIKMHQMPGDVYKGFKIQMMEGSVDESEMNRAKSFRKMVRARERAVLRHRTEKEVARALAESVECGGERDGDLGAD